MVAETWCGGKGSSGVLARAVSLEMALWDAVGLYPLVVARVASYSLKFFYMITSLCLVVGLYTFRLFIFLNEFI